LIEEIGKPMNTITSQMQAFTINQELNMTNLLQQLQISGNSIIYEEDEHGRTLLMCVCMMNHLKTAQTVRWLMDHHSLLDYQDNNGKTAVHYAAHYNSPEILSILLTHPADFIDRDSVWDLPDNDGRTALFYASSENINILLSAGASATHIDNYGLSPLLYCIQQGNDTSASELVSNNPELIVHIAPCGLTALHAALMMKNYGLLSAFVYSVSALEVKTPNNKGLTVMDMAIANKDSEAVNILWSSWAFSELDLERWIGSASCAEDEWKELLNKLKLNRRLSRAQCI
jgi:ankyrin repeat protein